MRSRLLMAVGMAMLAGPAFAGPALAQDGDLVAAFAPLLGKCWSGAFPGGKARDTHCFRAVEGGKFIEDRHIVSGSPGPYSGITYYRWDAADKVIRYHYYASDGGYSEGRAIQVAGGFDFPDESYVGPDGRKMAIRNRLRFDAAGGYHAVSEMRRGKVWKPLFSMNFTLIGPAPSRRTQSVDSLQVSRAIVRDSATNDADVAGYISIANIGVTADRLVSARCACAGRVELHRVERKGEKMSMESDWPLEIAPNSRTEVRPGTPVHLMLMGLKQPLVVGGNVGVILMFERAGAVQVDFHVVGDSAKAWLED
jgi:copper(I)-binding protein